MVGARGEPDTEVGGKCKRLVDYQVYYYLLVIK
jgi:hypothetical protein